MGRIAKVLDFIRRAGGKSDTKCDPGGGAIRQAPHAQPAGDDGHPLPGDYAVLVEVPQAGGYSAVGYVDPRNAQTAGPGERRIYARSADGAQVVELWLKSDGSARLSNADGFSELKPSGAVDINGCIIGTDGSVTSPSKLAAPSILGDDSELVGHRHPGVVVGGGVTGPNQPGDGGGGGGFGPAADNTWSGANTFEQPITVAEPTAPGHAASRAYVDAHAGGGGGLGGSYRGLLVEVAGAGYAATVTAERLTVEGADGSVRTLRNVSAPLDGAGVGAGGLDAGAVTAGEWYYVYVIHAPDPGTTTALASLSPTAPALPDGYTHWALVGTAYALAGGFRASTKRNSRYVVWGVDGVMSPVPLLHLAYATSMTAFSTRPAHPPGSARVSLRFVLPTGSSGWAELNIDVGRTTPVVYINLTEQSYCADVPVLVENTLYYITSGSSAKIITSAYGYEDVV